MPTEHEKQVIKDEKEAEKVFQAERVAGLDKAAAQEKADKNVAAKQEALTKANEAATKAHADLMQAQKEASQVK